MSSFRQPVFRERLSPGVLNDDGTITEGLVTDSGFIQASIQPFDGEELESLLELRRVSKAYALFTDAQVNTVREANPDTLTIRGEKYEAVLVEPWQNNVINHYRVLAVKIEGDLSAFEQLRETADGDPRITAADDPRIIASA